MNRAAVSPEYAPPAAYDYELASIAAYRVFRVAQEAFATGLVDPTGSVTLVGFKEGQKSERDQVCADGQFASDHDDPDYMLVIRRELVGELSDLADGHLNPTPRLIPEAPTRTQRLIEAWSQRRGGLKSWLGRLAIAKGWGYDHEDPPLRPRDARTAREVARALKLGNRYGDIVKPGQAPEYGAYTMTLMRREADGSMARQDELNVIWLGLGPSSVPSDAEIKPIWKSWKQDGYDPDTYFEVPLDRIASVSAVALGGAWVLHPNRAMELRQSGEVAFATGVETAGLGDAADHVRNVLGVGQTVTHLIPAETPNPDDQYALHRTTITERAAGVSPLMLGHLAGTFDPSTVRSVLTDFILNEIPETEGHFLKVRVENIYDAVTGQLRANGVWYGYAADTDAADLKSGDIRMHYVPLSRERREAISAAITARLSDVGPDSFERF